MFNAIKTGAAMLFSSPKILSGVGNAADALHYSKEEAGDLNIEYVKAKAALISASSPSAITRRLVAWVITIYWCLCSLISVALLLLESDKAMLMINFQSDNVNVPFMLVIGFYFSTTVIKNFKK